MPGKKATKAPTSQAQHRLARAAAVDPDVAKQTGMPQAVAKEIVKGAHGKDVSKLPEKKGKK